MVGFKFSSLIVFLSLLLVGCMPQNKQTDCGTNEAFSATLRTCVPIIPSENSFINISSFTPSYNISAFKDNTNNIYLAVGISNPYNQAFTLNWRRNYNGFDTAFLDDDSVAANRNFTPASFSSQVGAHIITVQVINSDNQVVDSHSWTITLTEAPTPFLTTPVPLNGSLGNVTRSASGLTFSITGFNNGGTILPSTQITWSLDSAIPVPGTECSVSNACYSSGGAASSVASYTTAATSTLAVGSHTVTAVLKDASRIYAQFTWTFNVVNPPKAKVAAVYTVDNDSNSNNYTIVARTGVPYSNVYDDDLADDVPATGFRNFFLTNAAGTTIYNDATRANFCIDFERDYGSQVGSYIDVRFYLDGNASPVATVSTSAADDKVCLSDTAAANLLNVIYNNANPNATENHILRARIFDQAIVGVGKEYTFADDFQAGSGAVSYPIDWTIVVKPQNDAPGASFGATQLSSVVASTPLNCVSNSPLEKSGCEVFTDTDFRVSLLALTDDYFMPPYAAYADANFNYTLRLYRNTTLVHTCSKTLAGMDDPATTDSTGPEFACTFNIPSFGALGPINTDTNDYTIEGEISDVGSPYSTYGAVAKTTSTFKWNLNVVETNTPPTIVSITPNSGLLNEGSLVNFVVSINDDQRDNHKQEFFLCKTPACLVTIPLPALTQTSNRTTNALNTILNSSMTLGEDFLHQLNDPSHDCRSISRDQVCSVDILVKITDIPFTTGTEHTIYQTLTFNITNINPTPQFNASGFQPDVTLTTHQAMVGIPFVLNPGTITDASNPLVLTERETRYQWYSSLTNAPAGPAWTPIPGATSLILNWTPSSEIAASGNNVYLKLCTQDQATYVISYVDEEVCTSDPSVGGLSPWVIKANRNYVALSATPNLPTTKNLISVWKGPESTNSSGVYVTPIYTAYVDGTSLINIEKSVLSTTGAYLPSGFDRITFDPRIPADSMNTILDIKDLSITGTNNSLYLAYRLSLSSTPTQYRLYVRRIDIGGTKSHTNFAENKSFGFSYSNPTIGGISVPGDITIGTTTDTTGTWDSLQINNATNSTVEINLVQFNPCPGTCSASAYATALVSAINSAPDLAIQGIYATLSTATRVLIKGSVADNNIHILDTNIGSMGKIYTDITALNKKWHVLFVASTGKMASISGPIDEQLTRTAPDLVTSPMSPSLNTIQNSSSISVSDIFTDPNDNKDYVLVGSISSSGAVSHIYKLEASTHDSVTTDSSGTGLFGGSQTFSLKVAATNGSGMNKYYAIADVYDSPNSSRNYFLVRLNAAMAIERNDSVFDPSNITLSSGMDSIIKYSEVKDINIVAYGDSARLFIASNNLTADTNLFAATFRGSVLTCHSCSGIAGGEVLASSATTVALTPVRLKTVCSAASSIDNCRLGTQSYSSLANYKDVVFGAYSIVDTSATDYRPAVSVFNLENESIHSSALDSTQGKYRPPFFAP